MQEKTKNKIVTIGFATILGILFLINFIKPDQSISVTERRTLEQFPQITIQGIAKGEVQKEWEKYVSDQFVLRDSWRKIKAFWNHSVFAQKDNNGLFLKDNCIYKIEYPLKIANVQSTSKKINSIYQKYLQGMKVYYAIIPDKNYYLEADYLKINFSDLTKILQANLPQMQYIDISKDLSLQDYYCTDLHWKQENLRKVVNTLERKMNLANTASISYQRKEVGNFYGAYYGQLGMPVPPDKMTILTNSTIENATTYNIETQKQGKIYDEEKYKSSSDKYDIYLSGPTPLITIENKNAKEGKELLLFRDSFGSSIAPLLLENYQKITLIDLRYMSSSILSEYIQFKDQDVLFLYSTLVLNQNVLR